MTQKGSIRITQKRSMGICKASIGVYQVSIGI